MAQNFLGSYGIVLSLALGLLALGFCFWNWQQTRHFSRLSQTFFGGKTGADLEHVLFALAEQLADLNRQHDQTQTALQQLRDYFRFAVQKVGLVKFNPFDDAGGTFSFSLALLDEENNGIVLTNMHGRQQTRIYSKKITQGESETALTEEEQQALAVANRQPPMGKPSKKTKAKTKTSNH